MKTVRAYYPQGEIWEEFKGEKSEIYKKIKSELSDPKSFTYCEYIDDIQYPCTLKEIKSWSK